MSFTCTAHPSLSEGMRLRLVKSSGFSDGSEHGSGEQFDAQVAKVTNQAKYKKWLNRLGLGAFCYVFSFFKVLFRYHPTEVRLIPRCSEGSVESGTVE
jgi:hypothetical protein